MLLDTNVISELWRLRPNPAVIAWLDAQRTDEIYLCSPVLAELHYGIERLADGERKRRLSVAADRLGTEGYRGRILSFDAASAVEFGRATARREQIGRRLEPIDAMIAAIALANRKTLVTRNITDFLDIGLDLINPFTQSLAR